MSAWTMGRQVAKKPEPKPDQQQQQSTPDQDQDPGPEPTEKPLPTPRPGTSGTEHLLVTNRRRASENYQQAQRAERAYRARKRAALARHNCGLAREHLADSWRHLRQAVALSLGLVRALPYLAEERLDKGRAASDEKKRQRQLEKRRRLEEALARETAASEAGEDGEKTAADRASTS